MFMLVSNLYFKFVVIMNTQLLLCVYISKNGQLFTRSTSAMNPFKYILTGQVIET
jgi:hypothetical protein